MPLKETIPHLTNFASTITVSRNETINGVAKVISAVGSFRMPDYVQHQGVAYAVDRAQAGLSLNDWRFTFRPADLRMWDWEPCVLEEQFTDPQKDETAAK